MRGILAQSDSHLKSRYAISRHHRLCCEGRLQYRHVGARASRSAEAVRSILPAKSGT